MGAFARVVCSAATTLQTHHDPSTQHRRLNEQHNKHNNTNDTTNKQWFFRSSSAVFAYCQIPGYEALCSAKQVAVRFSFANFSFFGAHALLLFWCTRERDFRAGVHTGLWFWKLLAWAGAIVGFFFVPAPAMAVYAQAARAGAGLFLVFVMVEMVSWVYDVNQWLVARDSRAAWAALVAGAAAAFLGGLAIIGAAYYFYAPSPGCHLNLFFITWSLVVGFALVGVLFVPRRLEVAGLLTSGAVFLYCAYLLYSALGRAPGGSGSAGDAGGGGGAVSVSGRCSRAGASEQWVQVRARKKGVARERAALLFSSLNHRLSPPPASLSPQSAAPLALSPLPLCVNNDNDKQIVGFFLGIGAVCYSTMSLGTSSIFGGGATSDGGALGGGSGGDALGGGGDGDGRLPYRPDAFHLIFALASMYMAMLLTNWQVSPSTQRFELGAGWASVWVTMGSKWFCEALYLWTVVAPAVLRNRDFT